ncbi:carotenoid oxygenase family protein [Nocardia amamiensis]|uniref:Dioxygenase n=1 Tax=Nocardia amamiensis TaxID=404578 RepID=A0ABS0D3L5_9NOCA|nr:carotenoid oxygenase family protein [Nocardia amamiensis]MBF6303020.1 carotenoid oxygenase family protein [Nocardia amamiensis]
MSKPFPQHPMLSGNFAPVMAECYAPELIVTEGELPPGLEGTLFRNGPNPMYPPMGDKHHWFMGEGMLHAISIADGRASYRNRWIETESYRAQRAAGRRLVPTTFEDQPAPGSETLRRHLANTHVYWHGDRLLAFAEGNSPVEVDPLDLATRGSWTFDGAYTGPVTGHPKIDPETGEMLMFSYMTGGPFNTAMSYHVVDAQGRMTRSEVFQAPYASMVHDFIATAEHVVFPIFPATIDQERIIKGGPVIAWDPRQRTCIGILDRKAGADTIRWFEGEPCYVFHPLNAYTTHEGGGTQVVADVIRFDRVPLFPNVDGSPAPHSLAADAGLLVRWTFELDGTSNDYKERVLTDLPGEFPRLDDRFAGLNYRHGFYAAQRGPQVASCFYDTLAHVDLSTGAQREWSAGPGCFVHEPVFVPRQVGVPEGDGWLVTLMYDGARNLSDLIVLDTHDVTAGPVARAELPVRVPFGFHGSWRDRG